MATISAWPQLGAFMAHEMGIRLARLNVMIGVAKLDRINKSDPSLVPLVAAARALESRHTTTELSVPNHAAAAGATL